MMAFATIIFFVLFFFWLLQHLQYGLNNWLIINVSYSKCLISMQVMQLQKKHALLQTLIYGFNLIDEEQNRICQDFVMENKSTSHLSKKKNIQHIYPYPTKESNNAAAFSLIAFESFSLFKGLKDECLLSYQQGHNRAPRINVL